MRKHRTSYVINLCKNNDFFKPTKIVSQIKNTFPIYVIIPIFDER